MQANNINVDLLRVTFLRNYVTSSDVYADEVTRKRDALVRPQFAEFPRSFSINFHAGSQRKAFHCYDRVLVLVFISNWSLRSRMPEILPLGQCS